MDCTHSAEEKEEAEEEERKKEPFKKNNKSFSDLSHCKKHQ